MIGGPGQRAAPHTVTVGAGARRRVRSPDRHFQSD